MTRKDRTPRRQAGRLLAGLVTALVSLLWMAGPAAAHTSLVESTPANRTVLGVPPEKLELVFSKPVDPKSVTIDVAGADGRRYEGQARITPEGRSVRVVEFSLPKLVRGTYGVTWQSLGADGHRVAGEVVFGVGNVSGKDVAGASFASVSLLDRLLDTLGGVGRFAWYVGLSLALGALYALWWLTRSAASQRWGRAGPALELVARRWLLTGVRVAIAGTALRWAATVTSLARSYGDQLGLSELMEAMVSISGTLGMIGLLVLAALHGGSRLLATSTAPPAAQTLALLTAGLAVAAALGVVGGHPLTQPAPALGAFLSATHVLAAAAWLGPLALVLLGRASTEGRSVPGDERKALLQAFFARYTPVAAWAFVLLVVTGVRALWINVGTRLFDNGYGLTLAVKLALVLAVLVPLGWSHDRMVRYRQERVGTARFGRTIQLEATSLVLVLALAAALTALNPNSGGDTSAESTDVAAAAEADLTDAEVVADVSECAKLTVGRPNCYRDFFADLMRREGAGAAVAKAAELSRTDPHVAADCHQVVHDIGNDAAKHYKNLAKALSFEGSACWSGYYHGVVEEELAGYDDTKLLAEMPTVCADAATTKYSFTHYNCVHGMGHGVMLRFEADLFRSIPYCEKLTDEWERSSCLSGVFMENVVSAQQGHVSGTFKGDDLVYPCNAVNEAYRDECFGMQPSYILWKTGRDFARTFQVCDAVEAAFVDDCYQSTGREVSGGALLEAPKVVAGCNLGRADLREHCIVGAALNAVYNDRNTVKATELCDAVEPRYAGACRAARDRAASTL